MTEVRVDAVIVTWNSAADIRACLDALLASRVPGGLSCTVLDNASSDETPQMLDAWRSRVRVLTEAKNHGYAEGNVLADAGNRSEYLLLLNPDCVVEPGCVAELVRHLDDNPSCAAASALLLQPDGSPQFFARREPTPARCFAWFLGVPELRDRLRGGPRRAEREYRALLSDPPPRPFEVDVPAAACVLLARRALPEPFLDPRFPLFFNDVHLFRTLRERGLQVEVIPTARALHGHGRSHRQLETSAKRAEQLLSLRRYARLWWPRPVAWLFDAMLLLDALACRIVARRRPSEREHMIAWSRGALGSLGLPWGSTPFLAGRPGVFRTR
jgi:GT2 family glycosyltransferase